MNRRAAHRLGLVFFALLCGCGGSDDGVDDASNDDASAPDEAVVDIPWLGEGVPPIASPMLTPCPDGWRERGEDVPTCDPFPEGGALECPAGQAHFPGEPACAPVGSPCPVADFSDALPTDRPVVFVQPGGTGDGSSPSSPHGSVDDFAFGGLSAGTVVALSRGTHTGTVSLTRGVVLWGACSAETLLTTDVPGTRDEGVVTITDAQGEARDLTVHDSPRVGVLVSGASAEGAFDGVVIEGRQTYALASVRGTITADSVVLRGLGSGTIARGLGLELGGSARITRGIVEGHNDVGVFADGAGALLELSDVVVRDTEARSSDGESGRGVSVLDGATAELTRVLVERNRDIGIFVSIGNASVRLSDAVVRDTFSQQRDLANGSATGAEQGTNLQLERVVLERNRDVAVFAADASVLTMADVAIRDVAERESDGAGGRGLSIVRGATADVARVTLERVRDVGVLVASEDTMATLSDLVVRDIAADASDGTGGRALGVQQTATLMLTRALLERSAGIGIFLNSMGTSVTLSDVVVRDTESQPSGGRFGRALGAEGGSVASLTRVLLERNREIGVGVLGPVTAATLTDVVVRDVTVRACADTTCPDSAAGHGVGSYDSASVTATRFIVEGVTTCALQLARDAQMDLADGEVRNSSIGICLQVDPYDTTRLTRGVRFVDNGVNLQTTTLPVPELGEPPIR